MKKIIVLLLFVNFQFSILNCFGQVSLSDLDNGNTSNVVWGIYNDVASNSTGNLYAISISSFYEYVPGMIINFKAGFTNSDSAYLKVNDLATVPIVKQDTLLLDSNDIIKGKMVSVIFNGLYFNLINNEQTVSQPGMWVDSIVGTRTFIVPAGVNILNIVMVGSGGGCTFYHDSYGNTYSCGGGDGQGFKGSVKVSPCEKITIIIGTPGQNGGPQGTNGQPSYIQDANNKNIITLKGGDGSIVYDDTGCNPSTNSTNAINKNRFIGDYILYTNPPSIRNKSYGKGGNGFNGVNFEPTAGCCMLEW